LAPGSTDGSIGNASIGDGGIAVGSGLQPAQTFSYGPLFPLSAASSYDYLVTPKWNTQKIGSGDDILQRRKMRAYALNLIKLKYDALEEAQEELLHDFFMTMNGSFLSFGMYDNVIRKSSQVYIGKGDNTGTLTTYNLNGKASTQINPYDSTGLPIFQGVQGNASLVTLYLNGIPMTSGWTLSSGSGINEQDQIVLSAPLANGFNDTLFATFTGVRYFPNCIFSNDGMDRDMFAFMIYKMGLDIQEV
jgi:hypothetical protein